MGSDSSSSWWSGEGLFRAIFEHAPTAIAIADAEGRFERCNPAYCHLLGWSEAELRDRNFADLVHPEDRAANRALVADVVAGDRQYVEVENRSVRRDGSAVWVHKFVTAIRGEDGAVSHLVALVTDISERRRLQAVLEASEEQFRSMFENAAVGVAHVGLDGRFVRVNAAFEQIAGRPADVLEGTRLEDIIHVDDRAGHLRHRARLERGEIERYSRIKRFVRPDDGEVWVNLTGSLVRATDGAPEHFVAVVEDISRELARREAEAAARLRSELSAELAAALDVATTVAEQAAAVVATLVPRFADYATVEAPGEPEPLLAAAHADPERLVVLERLRRRHRLAPTEPHSVARAARGVPQLIAQITPELRAAYELTAEGRELLERLDPRSNLSVPLDLGGGRYGAVMVGRSSPDRAPFDEADLRFAEGLADRAGVHLADSWLRGEEHRISLRLQQALLPDRLAEVEGVTMAARYRAATALLEVGGDWYDTVALPDGSVLAVVGDVVGHGLDAAAVMGRLRAGLVALAWRDADPGRLLVELDRFARTQAAGYATVACAVVDPRTGAVRYALAGHPPPLVVEPDGSTRWLDEALSVPLCTLTAEERPVATTTLAPGSVLVMVTDGLVERRGEPLDVGLGRLAAAASRLRDAEVGSLADRVVDALVGDRAAADDVVVLALRHDPAPTLRRSIPARPEELAGLRAAARAWLADQGIDPAEATDLVLALGEASSNAVEHAYGPEGDGVVDVVLRRDDVGVRVTVRDHGTWRPPPAATDRGRGTGIMEAVSTGFRRHHDATGTVVELVVPVSVSVPVPVADRAADAD